jgi:hypothetical protein
VGVEAAAAAAIYTGKKIWDRFHDQGPGDGGGKDSGPATAPPEGE